MFNPLSIFTIFKSFIFYLSFFSLIYTGYFVFNLLKGKKLATIRNGVITGVFIVLIIISFFITRSFTSKPSDAEYKEVTKSGYEAVAKADEAINQYNRITRNRQMQKEERIKELRKVETLINDLINGQNLNKAKLNELKKTLTKIDDQIANLEEQLALIEQQLKDEEATKKTNEARLVVVNAEIAEIERQLKSETDEYKIKILKERLAELQEERRELIKKIAESEYKIKRLKREKQKIQEELRLVKERREKIIEEIEQLEETDRKFVFAITTQKEALEEIKAEITAIENIIVDLQKRKQMLIELKNSMITLLVNYQTHKSKTELSFGNVSSSLFKGADFVFGSLTGMKQLNQATSIMSSSTRALSKFGKAMTKYSLVAKATHNNFHRIRDQINNMQKNKGKLTEDQFKIVTANIQEQIDDVAKEQAKFDKDLREAQTKREQEQKSNKRLLDQSLSEQNANDQLDEAKNALIQKHYDRLQQWNESSNKLYEREQQLAQIPVEEQQIKDYEFNKKVINKTDSKLKTTNNQKKKLPKNKLIKQYLQDVQTESYEEVARNENENEDEDPSL